MKTLKAGLITLVVILTSCGGGQQASGPYIDMTGSWSVTGIFGANGVVMQNSTVTMNVKTTNLPEQGDYVFILPANADAGSFAGGNTIKGTFIIKGGDFGEIHCTGKYTQTTYASDTCTFVAPPEGGTLPQGIFAKFSMTRN